MTAPYSPHKIGVLIAVFVLLAGYLHITQHQIGAYHEPHLAYEQTDAPSPAPENQELQHDSACVLQKTAETLLPTPIHTTEPAPENAHHDLKFAAYLISQYNAGFSARAPPTYS